MDKVSRCEVRHESGLPFHAVIFGEKRQVPAAEQSAGGIVGHGEGGGATVDMKEAHSLSKSGTG